jgi:hypothetical protein
VILANGVVSALGLPVGEGELRSQTVGSRFENINKDFIREVFDRLQHLRPGIWEYRTDSTKIYNFDQYAHLADFAEIVKQHTILASTIGGDYIVGPDIIIARHPVTDEEINRDETVVEEADGYSKATPLRRSNFETSVPILHASISCKWTIRSDRAQNTRTEALNLIRNRKGNLPHIVVVTAEPMPSRLNSLALGTGDLDCVYHFALYELVHAIDNLQNEGRQDALRNTLNPLIEGRRLRDISDLPFDLAC